MNKGTRLNELYKTLPYGGRSEVARRAGVTRQAVSDVLRDGKYLNDRVVEEALKYMEELARNRKSLEKKIDKLLNQ
ncbi:MAG: LacI family DNA-binding transcriptional regulator [Bacteroidota bacterium]|nr:LacI family DNA-binding transcriptional regulator [Bacteroidota bacterium]